MEGDEEILTTHRRSSYISSVYLSSTRDLHRLLNTFFSFQSDTPKYRRDPSNVQNPSDRYGLGKKKSLGCSRIHRNVLQRAKSSSEVTRRQGSYCDSVTHSWERDRTSLFQTVSKNKVPLSLTKPNQWQQVDCKSYRVSSPRTLLKNFLTHFLTSFCLHFVTKED